MNSAVELSHIGAENIISTYLLRESQHAELRSWCGRV